MNSLTEGFIGKLSLGNATDSFRDNGIPKDPIKARILLKEPKGLSG